MKTLWRTLAVLAIAVLMAGCGDDPVAPREDPTVSGSWQGQIENGVTLALVLSESESGVVTGSGSWRVSAGSSSIALSVQDGTHVYPNVSMLLESDGFDDVNLQGKVSGTQIEAQLDGSGFNGQTVILRKQ